MSSKKEGSFWLAVAIGFVLMVVLGFVPVVGPLVAGLVAGLIAGGGVWNGGKAGFLSGLFGAVILSVLVIAGSTFLLGIFGLVAGLGIAVTLIILALYHAVLGLIGGCIGGLLR
ncbi:MAG: DUF5518 domain-containing protein [Methanomicrobiales archaeon]